MHGLLPASSRGRAGRMPEDDDRTDVRSLVKRLEPVMLRRVIMASRLSPETLPDELLLLEERCRVKQETWCRAPPTLNGRRAGRRSAYPLKGRQRSSSLTETLKSSAGLSCG